MNSGRTPLTQLPLRPFNHLHRQPHKLDYFCNTADHPTLHYQDFISVPAVRPALNLRNLKSFPISDIDRSQRNHSPLLNSPTQSCIRHCNHVLLLHLWNAQYVAYFSCGIIFNLLNCKTNKTFVSSLYLKPLWRRAYHCTMSKLW